MILNGAYITNPPLLTINLKNDTAVKKDKKDHPGRSKVLNVFLRSDTEADS